MRNSPLLEKNARTLVLYIVLIKKNFKNLWLFWIYGYPVRWCNTGGLMCLLRNQVIPPPEMSNLLVCFNGRCWSVSHPKCCYCIILAPSSVRFLHLKEYWVNSPSTLALNSDLFFAKWTISMHHISITKFLRRSYCLDSYLTYS